MNQRPSRREVLELFGAVGVVFGAALFPGCAPAAGAAQAPAPTPREDFFFLQLSDTHVGYAGPADPEAATVLERTVARIDAAPEQPAFIVFTGDLTQTTDDVGERRARFARFREIVGRLRAPLRFLPGEHDAAPDRGDEYRRVFGDPTYAFDHGGVRFLCLDNASRPGGQIGDEQLAWLGSQIDRTPKDVPIVVFAHRPLFPLAPEWDWGTSDGARAIELLQRHPQVTVFYGHIHQEHHHETGAIRHHAARSLVFPLPVPGSAPKRAPLPWDAASPDHGLGHRRVALAARGETRLDEVPFRGGAA